MTNTCAGVPLKTISHWLQGCYFLHKPTKSPVLIKEVHEAHLTAIDVYGRPHIINGVEELDISVPKGGYVYSRSFNSKEDYPIYLEFSTYKNYKKGICSDTYQYRDPAYLISTCGSNVDSAYHHLTTGEKNLPAILNCLYNGTPYTSIKHVLCRNNRSLKLGGGVILNKEFALLFPVLNRSKCVINHAKDRTWSSIFAQTRPEEDLHIPRVAEFDGDLPVAFLMYRGLLISGLYLQEFSQGAPFTIRSSLGFLQKPLTEVLGNAGFYYKE